MPEAAWASPSAVPATASRCRCGHGIGIAEDDQARLFERFFRARNAADNSIPGTGLGLAISKAIVDAHGGTLTVESALDEGTAITVLFPPIPSPTPTIPPKEISHVRV